MTVPNLSTLQHDAEIALRRHFGHEAFREGQAPVVTAVLAGRDTIAIMPTGQGKSIGYQLPAVMLAGTTLVVSPLIALMKDQVDALLERGIPATFINSSLDPDEAHARLAALSSGRYKLIYVAPERFRNASFLAALQGVEISRFAIDEAHCVSQWGHDFRPDYLRLKEALEHLGRPPVLAATATATREVRADIIKQLGLRDPAVFVTGFDRPNLRFVVRPASGDASKLAKALEVVLKVKGSGIIYAATRKNVESIASSLNAAGIPTAAYHAGMLDDERSMAQDSWMDGTARVIVATNAFGMGVDKPNVRFVIHYDLPGTLEAYYQEAGRAGRDQQPSYCVLLYSGSDRYLQEFFIEGSSPSIRILSDVYDVLCSQGSDEFVLTNEGIGRAMPGKIHDMAIGTCLNLLERQGVLERSPRGANQAYVRYANALMPLDSRAKQQRHVLKTLQSVLGDRLETGSPLDLQSFVERVGEARDSVLTALQHLDERGLIHYTPPQKGRAFRLLRRVPQFKELQLDVSHLIGKQSREIGKLDEMVGYAQTLGCRREHLLSYFGDHTQSRCTACDRCLENTSPRVKVASPLLQRTIAATESGSENPALLAALRDWRDRIAKERGLPAYCILHDRVLTSLATVQPRTEDAIKSIKGIGTEKFRQWGEELLGLVAEHQK